ncbi:MAG: ribosome silencing factor [Actinomycetota bacterium]|nr:ribosome silencing factor [Actinomycetota bacterium]
MSELLGITDVFVIASGSSQRQVRTLAEEVEARLTAAGREPLHREGTDHARWVLLDYGDVVVHLFDEETRAFYQLERLWGDAPKLQRALPSRFS